MRGLTKWGMMGFLMAEAAGFVRLGSMTRPGFVAPLLLRSVRRRGLIECDRKKFCPAACTDPIDQYTPSPSPSFDHNVIERRGRRKAWAFIPLSMGIHPFAYANTIPIPSCVLMSHVHTCVAGIKTAKLCLSSPNRARPARWRAQQQRPKADLPVRMEVGTGEGDRLVAIGERAAVEGVRETNLERLMLHIVGASGIFMFMWVFVLFPGSAYTGNYFSRVSLCIVNIAVH